MLGRLDVIEEGVWADRRGGRIALLIESEDSNIVAIVSGSKTTGMGGLICDGEEVFGLTHLRNFVYGYVRGG